MQEMCDFFYKASISGVGISNSDKYKHVMENTSFSVNVLGGKTGTAAEMIISDCNVAEINRIIAGDMKFMAEFGTVS